MLGGLGGLGAASTRTPGKGCSAPPAAQQDRQRRLPTYMPDSIPLRQTAPPRLGDLLFDADFDTHAGPPPDTRSRPPSAGLPHPRTIHKGNNLRFVEPDAPDEDLDFDDWDESAPSDAMPSDLRPDVDRERDGRSLSPLLGSHKRDDEGTESTLSRSTHTFHERDPAGQAHLETRRRYTYAAIFLALSLVSFTVQTETAVYIQHELKWEKPYCML